MFAEDEPPRTRCKFFSEWVAGDVRRAVAMRDWVGGGWGRGRWAGPSASLQTSMMLMDGTEG